MADDWKAANAQIILDVLAAKGGDGRVLRAIAGRESGLNHAIRHDLAADRDGSRKAWERNAGLFANNPYYYDVALWDHGKGLFAMMPAYHLQRWDPTAHPDVLFNPYVASVAAARLVQRCIELGARSWADVNQCWATGHPRWSPSYDARRERLLDRIASVGYPPELADEWPEPGDWGLGPQRDQAQILWALDEHWTSDPNDPRLPFASHGIATRPTLEPGIVRPVDYDEGEDDEPQVVEVEPSSTGSGVGWVVGLGAVAGLGAMAWALSSGARR